ncbi:MAG: hypothetical protein IJ731_06105 [Eubacterium sp.]|nr:hypothetical protein [Eubacterium sp.]
MARKATELTCTCCIIIDGEVKDYESLADNERESIEEKWCKRLSDNMSRYYSAHPEERGDIYNKTF